MSTISNLQKAKESYKNLIDVDDVIEITDDEEQDFELGYEESCDLVNYILDHEADVLALSENQRKAVCDFLGILDIFIDAEDADFDKIKALLQKLANI